MKRIVRRLRSLRFFLLLWWREPQASAGGVANRVWLRWCRNGMEITLHHRDTRKPDGYSREELLLMLWVLREHERIQGWRVPEPELSWGSPPCASFAVRQ